MDNSNRLQGKKNAKLLFSCRKKKEKNSHNKQKVETIQMSIDKQMDKQTVIYTCNGILFSLIKEWNSDTCNNMDKLWKHYAKWNKPYTKGHILYDSTYLRYLEWENS